MPDYRSLTRRLAVTAGLAVAVLGSAALTVPTASADPVPAQPAARVLGGGPPLSALQVQRGGTEATVTFNSSEPAVVTYDLKRVSTVQASPPPRGPLASVAVPISDAPVLHTNATPPPSAYTTQHRLPLRNLQSNTAYDLFVTATTQSGQQFSAQTRFTTMKKRVFIALESINVEDDGDWIGNGEPLWLVQPAWTGGSYNRPLCYPNDFGRCEYGSVEEGRIVPVNSLGAPLTIIFAEENFDRFPDSVSLDVTAKEDDLVSSVSELVECISNGGCTVGENAPFVWKVPQGVESTAKEISLRGDDPRTGFHSRLLFRIELFHNDLSYPWHSRNLPSNTWFVGKP